MNAPLGQFPGQPVTPGASRMFGDEEYAGAQPGFTMLRAVRVAFKHKWLILGCFVLVTAAVAYGLMMLPPTFTSTAKVMIRLEEDVTPSFFAGITASRDNNADQAANRRIENEMELAETWPVAADVVRSAGVTYDNVYQAPLIRLLGPVSELYDHLLATLFNRQPDPDKHGLGETVQLFLKSYTVASVTSKSSDTTSNIIQFTLLATDPDRAQRSLQSVLDVYLATSQKLRQDSAAKAYEVIERRVKTAQAALTTAQGRLEAFLTDQAETITPGPASAPPSAGGAARTAGVADARGRDPALRDVTTPRDVTTLAQLKTRLIDMQLQLIELQQNYRGPNERATALEGAIAALRDQIVREQRRGARNDATVLEVDRELQVRQADLVEAERRLSQVGTFMDMGAQNVSTRVVVEPPLRPRSSEWKQRVAIGIAASIGGLFMGLALAGLREFLDSRLETTPDASAALGLPVIGEIGELTRRERRSVLDGPMLARAG